MGTMKTPGVYIVEKNAFPNSVVEVATAVPAFIGYTQKAQQGQKSITNKPIRITSLAQYESFFGGQYEPKFVLNPLKAAPAAKDDGKGKPDAKAPAAAPPSSNEIEILGSKFLLERSKFSPMYRMYTAMQMFYNNGGGVCYVVSVGNYQHGDDAVDAIVKSALLTGIDLLQKEQEPTMLVIPEAVSLSDVSQCAEVQNKMVMHSGTVMRNRMAILDVFDGNKTELENKCISAFRSSITAPNLDFASAYYPWIKTSLVDTTMLSYENFSSHKDEDKTVGRGKLLELILAEFQAISETAPADQKAAALATLEGRKKLLLDAPKGSKERTKTDIDKSLTASSNVYKMVLKEVQEALNETPPSAAMAGVYTRIDNAQGVWKAPANVGILGMVAPTVELSNLDQETLNVDLDGKSINAIRTFSKGPTVWGARTLDGNSLDWRYINVRRTMIMLEQSIEFAAKAYVFEANDGQTWVAMRSMINNFLTGIWKRGGLAGAVPSDAFSVHVGLGETMTSEDILEGILRITVLVAITRPAEFIEITFQQQMQKS